jgi:hypothetical protein
VPKRHAAIATITGGNVDKGFVDELHGVILGKAPNKKALRKGRRAFVPESLEGQAGVTLTVCLFRLPLTAKDT